jgi:hypothetical protein
MRKDRAGEGWQEDKLFEVIDNPQTQNFQSLTAENQLRTSTSRGDGNFGSRMRKSFQLMMEHKLIERKSLPMSRKPLD